MADDVVVVLPGIMGSTLADSEGRMVWAPSAGSVTRAVWNAIRNRKLMELREPVGDGPAGDGIRPAGLMPDVHALPGLWTPVKGYTRLFKHLEGLGYRPPENGRPGNLLTVPYDWRLSNRHNGTLLAGIVEPALERWRAQGPEHAEARLVFVCHSMGGLVASWYLHVEGGWGHTRKLITFGTPLRGAAKAADQLVHGAPGWLGRIGDWGTQLGRTLPSLHQLLPDYACVDDGTGTLTRLDPTRLPNTDTDLVADGLDFHQQLHDATATVDRSDDIHHLVGTRQPTTTTLSGTTTRVTALKTYRNDELFGDGTVPIVGAAPKGMPLDSSRLWRIPDKHGNVHRNRTALDQLTGILEAPELTPMGPEQGDTVRVDAPELIQAGDDLTVTVTRESGRDAVVVTVTDEDGNQTRQRPKLRGGQGTARFPKPGPGAHDIHITGPGPASSIAPVTHTCLVFDQPDDDPFDN